MAGRIQNEDRLLVIRLETKSAGCFANCMSRGVNGSLLVALMLLAGACGPSPDPTIQAPVPITVSNYGDVPLAFSLTQVPAKLAGAAKTNAPPALKIQQAVPANEVVIIEVPPGQYTLRSERAADPATRQLRTMARPFGGDIVITNAETWIWKLDPGDVFASPGAGGQPSLAREWKLEIPSRPGFQLKRSMAAAREAYARPRVPAPAPEPPKAPPVAVTFTNQGDMALAFTLTELLPKPVFPARQVLHVPGQEKTNPAPFHLEQTVTPKQLVTFEVPPGQYLFRTVRLPDTRRPELRTIIRPLSGYIMITNRELWMWNLEKVKLTDGKTSEMRGWTLEIPLRPEVQLARAPAATGPEYDAMGRLVPSRQVRQTPGVDAPGQFPNVPRALPAERKAKDGP